MNRAALGLVIRSRLRAEWRSLVVLVVLGGLGLGASFALVATARRTATAHDRFFDDARMYDYSTGYGPETVGTPVANALEPAAPDLDGVQQIVGFQVGSDAFTQSEIFGTYGFLDQATILERPAMSAGRLPAKDAVDEVLLTDVASERSGLEVGDAFDATVLGVDPEAIERGEFVFFPAAEVRFKVVGVGVLPGMVLLDEWGQVGVMGLSPAFVEKYWDLRLWGDSWIRLRPGASPDRTIEALGSLGLAPDENRDITRARVWQAVRPIATTLAVAGVFAFIATLVLLGQALSRLRQRHRDSDRVLRAFGATPASVDLASGALMVAVSVAAVVGGWVLAIALSPLAPIGPYRSVDPDRGVFIDGMVLGMGAVLVLLVVVGLAVLGRERKRQGGVCARVPRTIAGLPLSADIGSRWAFDRVSTGGSAFRSTAALTTAMGLVVTAIVFVTSLGALGSTPEWYGQAWEVWLRSPYGEIASDLLVKEFTEDPDVDGWVEIDTENGVVDGHAVPIVALAAKGSAQAWPTVVEGRLPERRNEIVVGRETLDQLGVGLGTEVSVAPQTLGDPADGGDPVGARRGTIVGVSVFPSVGYPGVDPPRLGVGVAVQDGFFGNSDTDADMVLVDLASDVSPAAFIRRQETGGVFASGGPFPSVWSTEMRPAEVAQIAGASGVVWLTVGGLGLIGAGMLAHLATTTVSRRRRDLGLLRALGFTGRQIGGVVFAQSFSIYAVAVASALLLGSAAGHTLWRAFANDLNVLPRPVLDVTPLLLLVLIGAAAVTLVALPSASRARRVSVAEALRTE